MSIFGKPITGQRTKFCFVYCGPDRCDCMPNNSVPYPIHPHPKGGIEEKKDPFEEANKTIKENK